MILQDVPPLTSGKNLGQALPMFPISWEEILQWLILCTQLLRRATMDSVTTPHIESSPDVAGGKPRITGHRITVHNVVIWHERMGLNADAIASQHGLSLADVYAALAYYYDHRQAIDETIVADESYVAELRNRTKSKMSGKIGG